jgi:D-alanyl-D-alanine dipeptidase
MKRISAILAVLRRRPQRVGVFGSVRAASLVAALLSAAQAAELPPGFARLADVAPGVAQEMRYAGPNNFTGKPVPGSGAAECWLRVEAARALARAQALAHAGGFDLVVYDCYRPKRAVAAFVAWSQNGDETTKTAYYPSVAKSALFAEGYIAEHSSHSTGLAVDLGVKGWDFGAPFDFFDKRSWTRARVAAAARANREKLVSLMRRCGFENYPREWWHFTLKGPKEATAYDVEIEAAPERGRP